MFRPTRVHVRLNALHLLHRLPVVHALEFALRFHADPEERVSRLARNQLLVCRDRFVHFYDKPPEDLVRRLLVSLEELQAAKLTPLREWFRGVLRGFLP